MRDMVDHKVLVLGDDDRATLTTIEALDLLESGTEPAAAAADDAQSSRPDAELASS